MTNKEKVKEFFENYKEFRGYYPTIKDAAKVLKMTECRVEILAIEEGLIDIGIDPNKKTKYPCNSCTTHKDHENCRYYRSCRKYRQWFAYQWTEDRKALGVNVDENY